MPKIDAVLNIFGKFLKETLQKNFSDYKEFFPLNYEKTNIPSFKNGNILIIKAFVNLRTFLDIIFKLKRQFSPRKAEN